MATLVLAAAGTAAGGALGAGALGVAGTVLGRAVGATLGAVVDQRLFGQGAKPVETGRVERFRLMGSEEGAPIPRVYGQMRVSGQMIWSSRFQETVRTSGGGGKGAPSQPTVREYSYSQSFAVALCEGVVSRIGRVWADGELMDLSAVNWRLYPGDETQLPDPLIQAVEGPDVPAYRGTAYVVFEDLPLGPFGNRTPQVSFEVVRRPAAADADAFDAATRVQGVALVPGTGEYSLATEPVGFRRGKGVTDFANVNNTEGRPDLLVSLDQLTTDAPACEAVSLVVSWFGDDLRLGQCQLRPKVEQTGSDAEMPWQVSGLDRSAAERVSYVDGRPGFGGTPADEAVKQAIRKVRSGGRRVMFYPFILMDIRAGNGLTNPWTGTGEQPVVPWRGRITTSRAPGVAGSPDGTPAAASEVAAYFGMADPGDFAPAGETVGYTGPGEWSYRRFILHYAHLCAAAGGVDAFCIGSEMRAMTQVRSGVGQFPAVDQLRVLAAEVAAILPGAKIGYAADWSEYFGYHPTDGSGDVWYHLDPLWSHPAIDFVGIDNYMPLSDWRDGTEHADAARGSVYDLDYLTENVAGGEGYDWYYASDADREAQRRTPITDGAYADPWVFRYKDLANWWGRPHWNRPGGVRDATPTGWAPGLKPIWFTEYGCPSVDKGTNQPNVFVDPASSENAVPYGSNGGRDPVIQARYVQATLRHWEDPAKNPVSPVDGQRMVDLENAYLWAWDARPWPEFPRRLSVWSDGPNYALGHWVNGRLTSVALSDAVADICARSGVDRIDVRDLHGQVPGLLIGSAETARASLQPLMLAYGFDAFEDGGQVVFRNRRAGPAVAVDPAALAVLGDETGRKLTRAATGAAADQVQVSYIDAGMDYRSGAAVARYPGPVSPRLGESTLPIAMDPDEAAAVADRWLSETRVARDSVELTLPRSVAALAPGDVLSLPTAGGDGLFRIDRIEETEVRTVRATRIESQIYERYVPPALPVSRAVTAVAGVPYAEFMDLPLLTGEEVPHAPHIAVAAAPWPGKMAVYTAPEDYGYALNVLVNRGAMMGVTATALAAAAPDRWSGAEVLVDVTGGAPEPRTRAEVLAGANAAAIRAGSGDWEIFQFAGAEPLGDGRYRLWDLLRGQAGTEAIVPPFWPQGADIVFLDGSAVQLDLPLASRGLARNYRVGRAALPPDDPSFVHFEETFEGVGLRPYAPAHLRAETQDDGAIRVSWIRRTRVDGDAWRSTEVPLGEAREAYLLRLSSASAVYREVEVAAPTFVYDLAAQVADGVTGSLTISVAQMSDIFGPGPFRSIVHE